MLTDGARKYLYYKMLQASKEHPALLNDEHEFVEMFEKSIGLDTDESHQINLIKKRFWRYVHYIVDHYEKTAEDYNINEPIQEPEQYNIEPYTTGIGKEYDELAFLLIQGYTQKEISKILNIHINTVNKRYLRLKSHLYKKIRKKS